jgi:hypothetical protein
MLFMKNLIPFLVIITLQSCAGVNQPVAHRPLVEQSFSQDYQLVSKDSWGQLSQIRSGNVIKLNAQDVTLGDLYFSATGKRCRKVFLQQKLTRLVCQDQDSEQWHLITPVISEYIER